MVGHLTKFGQSSEEENDRRAPCLVVRSSDLAFSVTEPNAAEHWSSLPRPLPSSPRPESPRRSSDLACDRCGRSRRPTLAVPKPQPEPRSPAARAVEAESSAAGASLSLCVLPPSLLSSPTAISLPLLLSDGRRSQRRRTAGRAGPASPSPCTDDAAGPCALHRPATTSEL